MKNDDRNKRLGVIISDIEGTRDKLKLCHTSLKQCSSHEGLIPESVNTEWLKRQMSECFKAIEDTSFRLNVCKKVFENTVKDYPSEKNGEKQTQETTKA